jgi:transcription elongation factor GreA
MTDNIISQDGYDKLTIELENLTKVKRREIAGRIQRAKDMGDLSENAEYSEAKDAQAFNEGRILELKSMVKVLTVVDTKSNDGTIGMGSSIVVSIGGKERKFTIVSFNEADPIEGKISNESPIGQALAGKKKGDSATVTTPRGDKEYKIIDVK